jgi:O-methyltransferase involved in polyketide biosynthesis
VVKRHAKERILFVAEGLLPYFSEEEHRRIFRNLAGSFPGQEMLFQTSAPSLVQSFAQYTVLSKMRTHLELRWGLEDSRQVSLLNPNVEFIREFPLLAGRWDSLPEPIRAKVTPDMARNIAKMVHVRFKEQ